MKNNGRKKGRKKGRVKRKAEREKRSVDFDSIKSIDLDTLKISIDEICAMGTVFIPAFDFEKGKRVGGKEYFIDENDIFIFEGIQALYPEVTALFDGRHSISIYVSVEESLKVGDEIFSPNEIRLFRRLVRDYKFRNASPEFTFKIWDGVRQNENKNIFPYCDKCDIRINSLLEYEISMIKPYLIPILDSIGKSSEYYGKAQDIINKMKYVSEISSEYMPCESVFHEFLG